MNETTIDDGIAITFPGADALLRGILFRHGAGPRPAAGPPAGRARRRTAVPRDRDQARRGRIPHPGSRPLQPGRSAAPRRHRGRAGVARGPAGRAHPRRRRVGRGSPAATARGHGCGRCRRVLRRRAVRLDGGLSQRPPLGLRRLLRDAPPRSAERAEVARATGDRTGATLSAARPVRRRTIR